MFPFPIGITGNRLLVRPYEHKCQMSALHDQYYVSALSDSQSLSKEEAEAIYGGNIWYIEILTKCPAYLHFSQSPYLQSDVL